MNNEVFNDTDWILNLKALKTLRTITDENEHRREGFLGTTGSCKYDSLFLSDDKKGTNNPY